MPAITSQNVALAIPKLVGAAALPALVGNLVMGNLVNRDFENEFNDAGDTVNVPIAPVMTSNNIAEGASVTTQNPSLGNAQVVLNYHREASFQIPDVTRIIARPELIGIYSDSAIKALAEQIETDILSQYPLLPGSVGTSNTALTEATIDSAETTLFKNRVNPGDPRVLVTSADGYSQLRQIPRFSEIQTIGSGLDDPLKNAIASGDVGRIKGMIALRSQYVPKVSNTTYGMVFTRNALALVIRQLPRPLPGTGAVAETVNFNNFAMRVIMSYNPNVLAQQVTVDMLYGVGVLRPDHGLILLS